MHVRAFALGKPVAAQKAIEREADTVQLFASNPRQWKLPNIDADADQVLVEELRAANVGPTFLHLPYLVNLASPNAATRKLSINALEWTLDRAHSLGAAAVVVHAGQAVGDDRNRALRRQTTAIKKLLGTSARGPACALELTAGGRGAIASKFSDACEVLDVCDGHPRLRLCVDTCHLHASGYDVSTDEGVKETFEELDDDVGLDRLVLIHANDSRDERGSRRDRHWHIGEGRIGLSGFRAMVRHPDLQGIPFICETPGELPDDRRNVARLKGLRINKA